MSLVRINPDAISAPLAALNPRRRKGHRKGRRRKNPSTGAYTKAAGEVFVPPIAFAGGGALAGLLVASVTKPERIRYAAGLGAVLGLVVMGVLSTDAIAHG